MTRLLLLSALIAGCAPSADLRIPRLDGPLPPGRLAVVPVVGYGATTALDSGDVPTADLFGSEDAHEQVFWTAFVTELSESLPDLDVELRPAVSDSGFVERSALAQGARMHGDPGRWTLETLRLPTSAAVDSSGADYVLFVSDVEGTTDLGGSRYGFSSDPFDGLDARGAPEESNVGVGFTVHVVLMRAGQDAPLVVRPFGGAEGVDALVSREVDRGVWRQAVERLASRVGAGISGGR